VKLADYGTVRRRDSDCATSVITPKAAMRDRVKTGHTSSDRDQFI
jgi:hypothetical protein